MRGSSCNVTGSPVLGLVSDHKSHRLPPAPIHVHCPCPLGQAHPSIDGNRHLVAARRSLMDLSLAQCHCTQQSTGTCSYCAHVVCGCLAFLHHIHWALGLPNRSFSTSSPKYHIVSYKKSRCFILVIVAYISYICLERENVVHAKKEEGEEIKVRHDERKKFLCKPSSDSLHCMNSSPNSLYRSLYLY